VANRHYHGRGQVLSLDWSTVVSCLVLSTYDINMKFCISYYINIILWGLSLYRIRIILSVYVLIHIIIY
jgi:hypothetical protein